MPDDDIVQPAAGVDMDAYDAQLREWGFEFEDDPEDDEETELTFLGGPDAKEEPLTK